jgi:hypothetical protein
VSGTAATNGEERAAKAVTWTRELPKVPGWYWFRADGRAPEAVQIVNDGHELLFLSVDLDEPASLADFDGYACEWYGPLEPPA